MAKLYHQAVKSLNQAVKKAFPIKAIELNLQLVNCINNLAHFFSKQKKLIDDKSPLKNNLLRNGHNYIQKEKYEKANLCFDMLMKIDPRNSYAYSYKALISRKLNNSAEALRFCEMALKLNPTDSIANSVSGLVHFYQWDFEKALFSLNKALAFNPFDGDALIHRGKILSTQNRFEEALACYDTALAYSIVHPSFYIAKGYILAKLGKHEDAITWHEKSIKSAQDHIAGLVGKGASLAYLNRYNDALEHFDTALQLCNGNTDVKWAFKLYVYAQKGVMLANLERYKEALECFDKGLREIQHPHAEAMANQGKNLINNGRIDKALVHYDKHVRANTELFSKMNMDVPHMLPTIPKHALLN